MRSSREPSSTSQSQHRPRAPRCAWRAHPTTPRSRSLPCSRGARCAAPIIGGTTSPLETQGTTLALPGALPTGTYYWAVTPKDSDGHPGHRSAIGSFTWTWPSQTSTALNDLNSDPRVLDPQFSWALI